MSVTLCGSSVCFLFSSRWSRSAMSFRYLQMWWEKPTLIKIYISPNKYSVDSETRQPSDHQNYLKNDLLHRANWTKKKSHQTLIFDRPLIQFSVCVCAWNSNYDNVWLCQGIRAHVNDLQLWKYDGEIVANEKFISEKHRMCLCEYIIEFSINFFPSKMYIAQPRSIQIHTRKKSSSSNDKTIIHLSMH